MIDESEYEYKEPEELNILEETKEPKEEAEVLHTLDNKDPKYFYYIDGKGNVCRKLRLGKKKKPKPKNIINYMNKINLTLPKVLVKGYVSPKFKTVRATGPSGGMIWVPGALVGKQYQVILVPKDDWILAQINDL